MLTLKLFNHLYLSSVLSRNFIGGDKCPMSSKNCGTVLIKQGTNYGKKIKKQMQISWDNVPLNPEKVGHLVILCVKWCKNITLAGHCL